MQCDSGGSQGRMLIDGFGWCFGLWLVPRLEILDACGRLSCFESLGRGVAAGVDVPRGGARAGV